MFEVGWSFHAIEKDKVMRVANPLESFPCVRSLITDIVAAFNPDDPTLGEETVNIICRRYTRGQSLPKHLDRPQLFDEDVYGCVLLNTSDQRLAFEKRSRSNDLLEGPHILEETPGLCFCQHDEARYEWIHGVDELSHGERISVTWRWIQVDAAAEGHEVAKENPQKGKRKGTGKGGKGHNSRGKSQQKGPADQMQQNHSSTNASGNPASSSKDSDTRRTRWGRK